MLKCSIDSLYKSDDSCQSSDSSRRIWEELEAELPVSQATCASFNNQLLVFGGNWCKCHKCPCRGASNVIYTYNEECYNFEPIGGTPDAQYLCFVSVFHSNKIFIAGGAENPDDSLNNAYIFEI